MKKRNAVLFIIMSLALLSACAHTQGSIDSASPVITRILQRGELAVGTAASMPPLNMITKDGRITGLEPDFAEYMAAAMSVKLRLVPIPFAELLDALQAGKVDMVISSMAMLPERNLKVAFVGPYFTSGKALLTKSQTLADAKEGAQLNSPETKLVALKGSTSQMLVEQLIPKAKLSLAQDYDEALKMVFSDEVHALVADYPFCVFATLRYPDKELISAINPLTYEPLGVAVPGNDPLLLNWVENFLKLAQASGSLDGLKNKWFGNRTWLKDLP